MLHRCAQVIAEVGSNYTARQIERMLLNLGQTLPVCFLLCRPPIVVRRWLTAIALDRATKSPALPCCTGMISVSRDWQGGR